MTYPLKLGEKVFATKDKYNLTFQEAGERFDIPIRTLFRWQNKLEPCTPRNKPATKINMEALAEDVEAYPDAYQWERAKRLGVAHRTVGDALKRLAIGRKKNTKTPKSR